MAFVVKDQVEKFRTDPLMIELSSSDATPICFAGCPHAKELERQQKFLHGCVIKRLLIVRIILKFLLYLQLLYF